MTELVPTSRLANRLLRPGMIIRIALIVLLVVLGALADYQLATSSVGS
jgi:hypothetical protein